jgi:hypothetical protein
LGDDEGMFGDKSENIINKKECALVIDHIWHNLKEKREGNIEKKRRKYLKNDWDDFVLKMR